MRTMLKTTSVIQALKERDLEASAMEPIPKTIDAFQMEPAPEKPTVTIRQPWLMLWSTTVASWISSPLQALGAAAMLPYKAWSLARVMISRKVSTEQYMQRWIACDKCALCVIQLRKTLARGIVQEAYCGGCGCPKWRLSRLRTKNKRSGWQCPRGLHDETHYDRDDFIDWADANGYADHAARWKAGRGQTQIPAARKGCGG